jgi:hypothetical protein
VGTHVLPKGKDNKAFRNKDRQNHKYGFVKELVSKPLATSEYVWMYRTPYAEDKGTCAAEDDAEGTAPNWV